MLGLESPGLTLGAATAAVANFRTSLSAIPAYELPDASSNAVASIKT